MRKQVFRKCLIIAICILTLLFSTSCAFLPNKEGGQKAEGQKVGNDKQLMPIEYEILNQKLLGKEFLQWAGKGLLERGACEYAREVKGEFVPVVEENSIFPEELVVMLEETLYQLDYAALEQPENPFCDTVRALGADEFAVQFEDMELLFPKLAAYKEQLQGEWREWKAYELLHELYGIPVHCFGIFHFSMAEGQDNYVFAYEWGGTSGAASVLLTERVGDDFVYISEFDLQNYKTGCVIQYEEKFYYVYLQNNGALAVCDGIRIHRLESDPKQENLLIRYLPDLYIWKKYLYYNGKYSLEEEALDNYIEGIKAEITSEDYLDRGTKPDGVMCYCIGEEESPDIKADSYSTTYKMDIANCGLPVYFWKTVTSYPSISEHLKIRFYYFDEESDSIVELERLAEDESPHGLNLIQMWFHEIDGKVYTFRIYHLSDYNYMLNVILLEGDQVTQISSEILLPQRKFVLTEGEVFLAGI